MKKLLVLFFMILFSHVGVSFGGYGMVPLKGTIERAYPEYKNSSEVTMTSGYGECSGSYWEITSQIDVDLSDVLVDVTYDDYFVYLYINDASSAYPSVVIEGRLTEPVWSDSKLGWYSGNDRCIGVVIADPNNNGSIIEFMSNSFGKNYNLSCWYRVVSGVTATGTMPYVLDGTNGNPDFSGYVPANTYSVDIQCDDKKVNAITDVYVYAKEGGPSNHMRGYYVSCVNFNIVLGESRDITWQSYSGQKIYIDLVNCNIER